MDHEPSPATTRRAASRLCRDAGSTVKRIWHTRSWVHPTPPWVYSIAQNHFEIVHMRVVRYFWSGKSPFSSWILFLFRSPSYTSGLRELRRISPALKQPDVSGKLTKSPKSRAKITQEGNHRGVRCKTSNTNSVLKKYRLTPCHEKKPEMSKDEACSFLVGLVETSIACPGRRLPGWAFYSAGNSVKSFYLWFKVVSSSRKSYTLPPRPG